MRRRPVLATLSLWLIAAAAPVVAGDIYIPDANPATGGTSGTPWTHAEVRYQVYIPAAQMPGKSVRISDLAFAPGGSVASWADQANQSSDVGLTTPFVYDGSSNVVMEVRFKGGAGGARAQLRIPRVTAPKGPRFHSAFVTLLAAAPSGVSNVSNTITFTVHRAAVRGRAAPPRRQCIPRRQRIGISTPCDTAKTPPGAVGFMVR